MNSYDVIVVGLGAMGSAACYHVALRGARVLGLERFDIPHAQGSSHGFSRMTRMAYHEHPDYVPLVKSSHSLWHDLEQQVGRKLIYITGGLYLGPRDGELVDGALRAVNAHGLSYELLERESVMRRHSQFQIPEDFIGLLERDAGFILPEKAIAAHAELALRRGAELHGREPLLDWFADDHGVRVVTPRGEYHAKTIIFCGGAWTDAIVKDLGIPLRVTRQVLGWVWPRRPDLFELDRMPVWAIDHLDGTIHYGFPMISDSPGFKVAHHSAAAETNPDELQRDPRPGDEQTFRPMLKQFIPQADGPLLSLRVCMYTNSPDHHFMIGRHPRHERVIVACGFSGHGFKFAPVIGKALSELALDQKTGHPIEFLSLSRFTKPTMQ